MNPADPNVQRVEAVAAALGDLREDLILVGGCAVGSSDFANLLPGLITNDSLYAERLDIARRRILAITGMAKP